MQEISIFLSYAFKLLGSRCADTRFGLAVSSAAEDRDAQDSGRCDIFGKRSKAIA
jgi:hypothetical protein